MIAVVAFLALLSAKATSILALAWLANACLRRAAASVRHFVWLVAFCAVLALPLLQVLAPIPGLAVVPRIGATAPKHESVLENLTDKLQGQPSFAKVFESKEILPDKGEPLTPVEIWHREAAIQTTLPIWPALALWAIFLGMAITLLSGLFAYGAVQRLPSRALDAPSRWSSLASIRRSWSLRQSLGDRPLTAMTWGVLRPVVLMPFTSSKWRIERYEAVVLHELAHVRRYDGPTQLAAFVVCALNWFNPVCWICAKAMKAEAEKAADDLVLNFGVKPSSYATALIQTATELSGRGFHFAPLGVFFMKQSKIESRVKAILDSGRNRRGMTTVQAVLALVGACALVVPLAAIRGAQDAHAAPAPSVVSTVVSPSKVGFEAQPYRYLLGIVVSKTGRRAIIDMGNDRGPQIISVGMRIPGTSWRVVSIDSERAILRRSGNVSPHEVVVRLEVPGSVQVSHGSIGHATPPTRGSSNRTEDLLRRQLEQAQAQLNAERQSIKALKDQQAQAMAKQRAMGAYQRAEGLVNQLELREQQDRERQQRQGSLDKLSVDQLARIKKLRDIGALDALTAGNMALSVQQKKEATAALDMARSNDALAKDMDAKIREIKASQDFLLDRAKLQAREAQKRALNDMVGKSRSQQIQQAQQELIEAIRQLKSAEAKVRKLKSRR